MPLRLALATIPLFFFVGMIVTGIIVLEFIWSFVMWREPSTTRIAEAYCAMCKEIQSGVDSD